MGNNVSVNKVAIIERLVKRAREEYAAATDFPNDLSCQNATVLNIQRACEAALDMGGI
jgi:hypothetical protein